MGKYLPCVLTISFVFILTLLASPLHAQQTTTVTRIVDGDTLKVFYLGNEESIRLIGIDTPESRVNKKTKKDAERSGQDIETIITMGKRATKYVESLVKQGDTVTIEFDAQERDKYGRLLCYVYLSNGKMLNEEIVKAGYANVMTIPPNVKYKDRFLEAYQEAREDKRGLQRETRIEGPTPEEGLDSSAAGDREFSVEGKNQGFDISTARPVEEKNQGFDPTRSVPVEGKVEANPFDQFDTPKEKDPFAGLDPRFDNASTPIDKDPFARFVTPQDQLSRDRPEKSNTGSLVSQFWGAICAWLALSAVYTWGIGLTPPLLIRFLIVRRPINKWWAIGTAVGFFFINTILFIILNKVIADAVGSLPRMHNPMAMILIAFVSYLILRKKLRHKSQSGKKSNEKVIKTKIEAEDYVVSSKLPVISKSKQGSMGAEVSPCPKCSQLNTSRRTTCKYCGAVLEGYCPECKEPIRPGESYCSKCYPNKEIDTVKSNSTGGDQKGDTSNNTEVGFVNEKIVRYISIGIGVLITFIILHIYNESFVDGGLFAWYIQDTMVFELLRGFTHEIDYRNDEEIAYFLWFVCFGGGVFLSWKYRVKTAGVLIKMIKALHEKA